MLKDVCLESHVAQGFDLLAFIKVKDNQWSASQQKCYVDFTSKSVFGSATNLNAIQASNTGAWQIWSPQPDITLSSSYSRKNSMSHSKKKMGTKLNSDYLKALVVFRIQQVMLTQPICKYACTIMQIQRNDVMVTS